MNIINGVEQKIVNTQLSPEYLLKLKQSLSLTHLQMIELVEDEQKFVAKIIGLNQQGIQSIIGQEYKKALIYLEQAQKILEYSASCGKSIDRYLIISTLQNQASTYHKLHQFHKAYDYMEAILFNMETYFEHNSNIENEEQITKYESNLYKTISSLAYRKINTVIYYLQFAAISSQVDMHTIAIRSVKKSLSLLREYLFHLITYVKYTKESQNRYKFLTNLSKYCEGVDKMMLVNLVQNNREMIKNMGIYSPKKQIYEKLIKFSIGEIMEIQPLSTVEANQSQMLEELVSQIWLYRVALIVSVTYYTIATEMRLSLQNEREEQEIKKKFEKCKVFHLYSIRISCQLVPFVTLYHEQIVQSLWNNYQIDLNEQSLSPITTSVNKFDENILDDETLILQNQEKQQQQQQDQLAYERIKQSFPSCENFRIVRKRKISTQSISPKTDKNKNEENKCKKLKSSYFKQRSSARTSKVSNPKTNEKKIKLSTVENRWSINSSRNKLQRLTTEYRQKTGNKTQNKQKTSHKKIEVHQHQLEKKKIKTIQQYMTSTYETGGKSQHHQQQQESAQGSKINKKVKKLGSQHSNEKFKSNTNGSKIKINVSPKVINIGIKFVKDNKDIKDFKDIKQKKCKH